MENLVAVYASRGDAQRVRDRLIECGIAADAIALSPDTEMAPAPAEHETSHSWWDWLFGSDVPDTDRGMYRSTLGPERTAVSVHLSDPTQRATVANLMHDEGALDISGAAEPIGQETAPAMAASPAAAAMGEPVERRAASTRAASPAAPAPTGEAGETHIPLAKEELVVGKQQTERRIHVRVYPVTRTVEESVRLRDERVVVERRPLSGDAACEAGLAPRDLEIVERHEEPVASKRTRATEEVVLRKDVNERTEKVQDRVTETKVDVDRHEGDRP